MIELYQAATADEMAAVRHVNAGLCMLAFGLLVWRLIGRWDLSFPLGRVVLALFAALEFFVALGIARRAALGGSFNEAEAVIMAHAVVTIGVLLLWHRIGRWSEHDA